MFESRRRRSNKSYYENQYLTIEALESGDILFDALNNDGSFSSTIYYSINDGWWTRVTTELTLPVSGGDKVRMYTKRTYADVFIEARVQCNVYGNIMSMLHGEDFKSNNSLYNECFGYFFSYSNIVDASNLILPATTLAEYCYNNMFYGCTELTTAPSILPATKLTKDCYTNMFCECIKLTIAPELPATTLAENCYNNMFGGCVSLTTAPELPATILAEYCYSWMFHQCSSLTTAPELPATTLANNCYSYMFNGCSSLTTAPELPATTLANNCYSYMFNGCKSLTTVPDLPATVIAYDSCEAMFYGCSSLRSIALLAQSISEYGCQYMFYKCSKLKQITMLATSIGTDGLRSWVKDVASTGTFTKAPSMTSLSIGVNGIPYGWMVKNSDGTVCCFVAGTKVTMSDGTTKNIEDIKEGDRTLSLNINNNELCETVVKKVIIKTDTTNIARVTLKDGNSVTMNEYHPLLTQDGWKSLTNYKNYPTLSVGDLIINDKNNPVEVIEIKRWVEETPITTYNLDVAYKLDNYATSDNDNFFANGVCAHNLDIPCYG